MKTKTLTYERAAAVLNYDPDTGHLTWKTYRSSRSPAGGRAGGPAPDGRRLLAIDGIKYKEHRVAWLLYYGCWPEKQIDHVNGDPSDNRICNLRLADNQQNNANVGPQKNNKLGIKGVYFNKRAQKYQASIGYNYRQNYLGLYDTAEEAAAAYENAAKRLFGEFSRTN